MKDGMTIVPAEESHRDRIIHLFNEGFLKKFRYITIREDLQKAFVRDFDLIDLHTPDKHFVALVDNRVLGFLILHFREQPKMISRFERPLRVLLKKYGFRSLLKAALFERLFRYEPPVGELYIDTLGVGSEARGQGIGSGLLRFSEEFARSRGMNTLSLMVMFENPRAKALYEKTGFVIQGEKRIPRLKKTTGYSGGFIMKKSLD